MSLVTKNPFTLESIPYEVSVVKAGGLSEKDKFLSSYRKRVNDFKETK